MAAVKEAARVAVMEGERVAAAESAIDRADVLDLKYLAVTKTEQYPLFLLRACLKAVAELDLQE